MSFSYAYPGASAKDALRFLVSDTNTNQPLLSNEEMSWLITEYGSAVKAAPEAALAIARKFAMQATIADPALRVDYTERAKHYFTLAKDLRTESRRGHATVYAGGISQTDKDSYTQNTDRVPLGVRLGQFDHHGSPREDDGL